MGYSCLITFRKCKSSHRRCSIKKLFKKAVKARIHCEIFLSDYFTIVFSLCKLPRNVHDILFETFMKHKNSENRFSEFSLSRKTLLLNLFPWLINPFVITGVYKGLKENVSITWKASKAVFGILRSSRPAVFCQKGS